jgi:hypothetical protein
MWKPGFVFLAVCLSCTLVEAQADAGRPFENPPMISSHHGKLHVDLTAASAEYTIDGHSFQGTLYNDSTSLAFEIRRCSNCDPP